MHASQKITHRPAWASYWKSWFGILIVVIAYATSSNLRDELVARSPEIQSLLPWLTLIPVALILFRVLIHRYSRTYQIEQRRRIRNTTGIVSRARREFLLSDKIQTDLKQSIIGRLLNYGTLRFWTGDEQSGFAWINVHDPARRETEVKELITSTSSVNEPKGQHSQPLQEATPLPAAEEPQITLPPQGAEFADHVVIIPPLPEIIQTVASSPKYISSSPNKEHDHRFIKRGEPLIAIDIPHRDLFLSSQKFERVTIPSPVTGLIVSHAYELTKEMREHKYKNYSEVDPSHLMLTSILPLKDDAPPDSGEVIFADLRASLWANREYLFRGQRLAKHPAKARYLNAFQTDDGVRAMLDDLSNQTCDVADAKKYYHDYINETWFKRPELRVFFRHLVDEDGLRSFLAEWNTVPLDRSVEAALMSLKERTPEPR